MTPKERLYAAARRHPTERPPCICPGGMMNMMFREIMEASGWRWPEAHMDAHQMAGLAIALNKAGGFENYGVPFCMTVEAEAMGAEVNMGDLLAEPHITDYLLAGVDGWTQLNSLDLNRGRVKTVLQAIALLKQQNDGVPIIANITGPVSVAGSLVDISTLLKAFRKNPKASSIFMDSIAGNLIAYGQAQLAAGADAVCLSEPSGTGEILGPKFFREYSVKYINQIMDALQPPLAMVHICGNLHSVYDLLPELHCDIFSFDSLVPIADIKAAVPEKAVMGNVNTHALGTSSPKKIAQLVRSCHRKGADIIAPACGLPTTTPLVNVQAMVAAAQDVKNING